MKMARFLLLASCLFLAACNNKEDSASAPPEGTITPSPSGSALPGAGGTDSSDASSSASTNNSDSATNSTSGTGSASAAAGDGIQVGNGRIAIDAKNTTIRFIGTHVGANPNPRTGQFGDFTGTITLDNNVPKSIELEIQTESITTDEGEKLTTHLKSGDFFDVREFPTATFKSSSIEAGDDDTYNVKGDLTLHGETKEIEFPVVSKVSDGKLTMTGAFTINRLDFKMSFGTDSVVEIVTINVAVGTPTTPFAAKAGGGGFDPAQFFKGADKDADGKLSGDEIQGPMKDNLQNIDTDKDGAVSLDEFTEAMKQLRGGGGRGGPGRGGPGAGGAAAGGEADTESENNP